MSTDRGSVVSFLAKVSLGKILISPVSISTRDAPIRVFGTDHRVGGGYGDLPFNVLYCELFSRVSVSR